MQQRQTQTRVLKLALCWLGFVICFNRWFFANVTRLTQRVLAQLALCIQLLTFFEPSSKFKRRFQRHTPDRCTAKIVNHSLSRFLHMDAPTTEQGPTLAADLLEQFIFRDV